MLVAAHNDDSVTTRLLPNRNLFGSIVKKLITPRQQEEDIRNREFVLNVLLAGTLLAAVVLTMLLLISFGVYHLTYIGGRVVSGIIICGWLGLLYGLSRLGRYKLSAS